jgi:hypothetical protein
VRPIERSALDADAQAQLARLLDALRRDADLVARLRTAQRAGSATREQFDELTRLEGSVGQLAATRAELSQGALDLAERLTPPDADATGTLADALAPAPAPPAPTPLSAPPATSAAATAPAARAAAPPAPLPLLPVRADVPAQAGSGGAP